MGYLGNAPADQAIRIGSDTILSSHIDDGVIVNADINASAAIALSKTALVAGTGITLSTNTLNVDAAQTQITSVGTIGTGVWNGTAIASAYLDADTAHLSTTQTFSGAKTFGDDVTIANNKQILGAADGVAYSFTGDTDTGIQSGGTNTLQITTGGSKAMDFDGNQLATFTGKVLIDHNATNRYALEIDHEGDAYNALHIDASALTTGSGLHIYSNANRTADYPLVELQDDNASSSGYGLKIRCDGDGDFIRGMAQGNNTKWKVTNTGAMEISGANYDQLKITGSGSESGIKFVDAGGTTDGFVYASGETIGFLASNGSWTLQTSSASATFSGHVYATSDVYAYYSSDPILKENKELIDNPLDKICKLGGYSFDWKKSAKEHGEHLKGKDYGIMADEVQSLFPELVQTRDNGIRAVKYDKLVPLLIEGIKELKQELNMIKGES